MRELRVEYPKLALHDVQSVAIERDLNQPDVATILVMDRGASIGKAIHLGDMLKIYGVPPGADRDEEALLFAGELLGLEYQTQHSTLMVQLRAFGLLHRLTRRRIAASIPIDSGEKQIKAIIEELTKGTGVAVGKVASRAVQVSQYAHLQTPFDVLGAMAYEAGCAVWIDDQSEAARDQLVFEQVPLGGSPTLTFVPKRELKGVPYVSARAEVSLVRLPSSVEVRGWNAKDQKAIVGIAKGADVASGCKVAFPIKASEHPMLLSESDLLADGDAEARAQHVMARAAAQAASAEVVLDTLPPKGVVLGGAVKLAMHDQGEDPMNGSYFVRGLRISQRAGGITTSTIKLSRHVVPKDPA